MKKLIKFIENDLPLVISGTALVTSIVLAIVNAVMRYTVQNTINGVDSFITLCFAYAVYVGSAAALKRGQHYGIDILTSKLKGMRKEIAQLLLDIIILVVMILGLKLSIDLYLNVGNKTFEGLSTLSYRWYDLSVLIGFGYSVIYSIEALVNDIKKYNKKEDRV